MNCSSAACAAWEIGWSASAAVTALMSIAAAAAALALLAGACSDDSDDAATRAIPAQRPPDAETATEKLNTRPDTDAPPRSGDETTRRGSGPGVSAQDLLRREGRL